MLTGIIVMRIATADRQRRGITSALVKLYGLLAVAGFALLLAWSGTNESVKASGFTLFGTIAGFLAGADIKGETSKDGVGDPKKGTPPAV